MSRHIFKSSLLINIANIVYIFLAYFVISLIWFFVKCQTPADFIKENKDGLLILMSITLTIGVFIVQAWHQKRNKKDLFYRDLRERVCVLDKFSGKRNRFFMNRTIYGTMISILERCRDDKEEQEIKMLLCSPALDTPERIKGDYEKWGDEFYKLLSSICNKDKGISSEICILPDIVILGFNPLKGFIETLSYYCSNYSKKNSEKIVEKIFRTMYEQTSLKYQDFYSTVKTHKNVTVKEIIDIPFQMILRKSKNVQEVVISFAGKTILEASEAQDQKGFYSSDKYVVNAFNEIYESYTKIHNRLPLKPFHTQNVIKKCSSDHIIKHYHNLTNCNIKIPAKTFSPYYANSSKFTTDVVLNIINENDSIMEIGAGSGIQAIAINEKLKQIKSGKYDIWAIEPFNKSIEDNCKKYTNIVVKKWQLAVLQNNKIINCESTITNLDFKSVLAELNSENKLTTIDNIYTQNKSFNIIIGDLPFVSAPTNKKNIEELAYYDFNHKSHRALFRLFANEKWIREDAILITAFSTLGGYEEVNQFGIMIKEEKLRVIQNFCYLEEDYYWYVFCIVKESYYQSNNKNYWYKRFNINIESMA